MGKWKYKTIDSICKMIADGDWIESKDQSTSGIRLLQTGNVGNGVYFDKPERAKYISSETFSRLNCTEVLEGDILISRLPDPVGRACIVPNLKGRAITAVDCTILRIDKSICYVMYIRHVLKSPEYFYSLNNFIVGSTRNRISRKNLQKVCIPIPPLEIQNKISKLLDNAEKIVRLKENQIEKLDLLIKSQFIQMFGDQAKNPYKWDIYELGSLLNQEPQNGLYKPSKEYSNNGSGCPIIRIDSFYNGKIVTDKPLKRLNCSNKELATYGLVDGNILINRVNSIDYLGKCALVDMLSESTVFESNMMRLDVNKSAINPRYLTHCLCDPNTKKQILRFAKKSVNQASINQKDVQKLLIVVPPLSLQNQFSDFVQQVEQKKTSSSKASPKWRKTTNH